jgi:hypothetical protein
VNPEIKQQWIDALRSGEYQQGRLNLKYDQGEGTQYCCLGVLCELAKASGDLEVNETRLNTPGGSYGFYTGDNPLNAGTAYPPSQISEWAGLGSSDGQLSRSFWATSPRSGGEVEIESLAAANDHGFSFEEIARLIEEQF